MIITHTDGVEVDTDKLPDIDAQILEKTEELRKLCESTNRLFLLHVDVRGNKQMTVFWNYKNGPVNEETMKENFTVICGAAHTYFMRTTNNQLGLFPVHAVDVDKLKPNS